jgi:hypothetical protein
MFPKPYGIDHFPLAWTMCSPGWDEGKEAEALTTFLKQMLIPVLVYQIFTKGNSK